MNKVIDPYDLGKINIVDYCQKIDINDFVRRINTSLKRRILGSKINLLGINVGLTTSNTRFGGKRFWFSCPLCKRRVGVIYKHPVLNLIGCIKCLKLKYKNQRLKGMYEGELT